MSDGANQSLGDYTYLDDPFIPGVKRVKKLFGGRWMWFNVPEPILDDSIFDRSPSPVPRDYHYEAKRHLYPPSDEEESDFNDDLEWGFSNYEFSQKYLDDLKAEELRIKERKDISDSSNIIISNNSNTINSHCTTATTTATTRNGNNNNNKKDEQAVSKNLKNNEKSVHHYGTVETNRVTLDNANIPNDHSSNININANYTNNLNYSNNKCKKNGNNNSNSTDLENEDSTNTASYPRKIGGRIREAFLKIGENVRGRWSGKKKDETNNNTVDKSASGPSSPLWMSKTSNKPPNKYSNENKSTGYQHYNDGENDDISAFEDDFKEIRQQPRQKKRISSCHSQSNNRNKKFTKNKRQRQTTITQCFYDDNSD